MSFSQVGKTISKPKDGRIFDSLYKKYNSDGTLNVTGSTDGNASRLYSSKYYNMVNFGENRKLYFLTKLKCEDLCLNSSLKLNEMKLENSYLFEETIAKTIDKHTTTYKRSFDMESILAPDAM